MPKVRMVAPGRWALVEPYVYEWVHDGAAYMLVVPEGFQFDFASVPRPVWALISPYDLSAEAPLVHDWMYHNRGVPPPGTFSVNGKVAAIETAIWSRRDVDRLFGRMMRERGVARWRRRAAYLAVRLFGRMAW